MTFSPIVVLHALWTIDDKSPQTRTLALTEAPPEEKTSSPYEDLYKSPDRSTGPAHVLTPAAMGGLYGHPK